MKNAYKPIGHVLFIFIIAAGIFFSCKKDDQDIGPIERAEFLDQNYGPDEKQKFNIYLPANRSVRSTPLLILIHGGAWMSGDRSDFNSSIGTLKDMFPAYAIVTMSYRLYDSTGANKFPVQESDVKACIDYLFSRNEDYIFSQKFAIMGISAGAHLATLYAYKHTSDTASYKPMAVVDIAGPVELTQAYDQVSSPVVKGWISAVAGNRHTTDSLLYISSSPFRFVTALSPPTLILHGATDTIVPPQQALLLRDKLQQSGVIHTYKLYTGEGHFFSAAATADALSQMVTFLNTNVK